MYAENLDGGITDFFNDALKEIAPTLKSTLKEAAGKLVTSAKTNTSSQVKVQEAERQAVVSNLALKKNKQLMMIGGFGLGALLLVALMKK